MTPELIAIIVAAVALAALILRQGAHFERRIDGLKQEFSERFDKLDERFDKLIERFDRLIERFDKLIERFDRLIERKLEGSLEGGQEVATCNRAA